MKHLLITVCFLIGAHKYIKIDFLCYGLDDDILKSQKDPNLKRIVEYDTTMTSMVPSFNR